MTEEEKEAIGIAKTFDYRSKTINYNKLSAEDVEAINIILNLIDKLQQENTSLKKEIKLMKSININENFINKEIIRNKIKELKKENEKYFDENGFVPSYIQKLINNNNKIVVLEELLGDDINEN